MLEAFGLSDPGCVRQNNEDFYLISPTGAYIVADGMGGAQAGEHASKLAVETVASFLQNAPSLDAETLFQALREANQRVMKEAASNPELEGMGTTLVGALEHGDEVLIASVGDSRAYILHGDELRAVTQDQTWVQEVGRGLGLDEDSLRTHPMRHVLTMAVGVGSAVRILYYALELERSDLLLLTTDGLHGVVSEHEIKRILQENGSSLESRCQQLMDAANEAGSPDNVTVMLLRPVQ